MKLTFERLLLIVIVGLLIFNSFFSEDNLTEGLLMEQTEMLTQEIKVINKHTDSLRAELESIKRDTVREINNYYHTVKEVSELIKEDSSNANRVIRRELAGEGIIQEYSSEPLTDEELARVGFKLIEGTKNLGLLNNYKNREAHYEMLLISEQKVNALQKQQIENLKKIVDEVRPSWYEKPLIVAVTTAGIIIGIFAVTN